jgi:hypothetical protein
VRSDTLKGIPILTRQSSVTGFEPQISGSPYSLFSITYPNHPAAKTGRSYIPIQDPPTYYPFPVIPTIPIATPIPSLSRGYGSLLVKISYPDQLYQWIKSDFFATDMSLVMICDGIREGPYRYIMRTISWPASIILRQPPIQ